MADVTLRTIWGIAKSKELQLTDQELHDVAYSVCGKTSLKKLTKKELETLFKRLQVLKDKNKVKSNSKYAGRGNVGTVNQRKKIYKLAGDLGWDLKRLNGMAMRMFKISSVEWLTYPQCSNLIEALKAMIKRREDEAVEQHT